MAYNKNTDYQALINAAVAQGDYKSAAKYEQQRNEKIAAGNGGSYQQTNNYSKYLNSGSGSSSRKSSSSSNKNYWNQMTGGVDYSRRPDLAGQVVSQGGTNVYYDENGYATKGTHYTHDMYKGTDKGISARSEDSLYASPERAQWGGSDYDQYFFSNADLQNAANVRKQAELGQITWKQANDFVESIRAKYGYSGGSNGSGYQPINVNIWNPDGEMVSAPYQGPLNTGVNYDWGGNIPYGYDGSYSSIYNQMLSPSTGNTGYDFGNYGNMYEDYLNQINSSYNQILSQQQAAQNAATQQAINSLTGQKSDIEQSYDDLYRQLYLERRRAEKNLPQQLAAMGISGGVTEGTALGIQTDYTNALRQGEQEKLGTLSDIDQAISDARLSGDAAIAQQAAQLAMQRLSDYGNAISALQQQQNWAQQMAYQQHRDQIADQQWQQQFNRQQMLDEISNNNFSYDQKLSIAQYLYENTGDTSGFRALGFTDQQISALNNAYASAMQSYSSDGTSSGNSRTGSSGSGDNNNRYDGNQINEYTGPSMNDDYYRAFAQSVLAQLRSGATNAAIGNVNSRWNEMSPAQQAGIQNIFGQYGYQYIP